MSSTNLDFTNIFSDEISQIIFSYLDPTSLISSNKVNKNWKRLTDDDRLWNLIAKKYFNYLSIPKGCQNIKAYLANHVFSQEHKRKLSKELQNIVKEIMRNELQMYQRTNPQ